MSAFLQRQHKLTTYRSKGCKTAGFFLKALSLIYSIYKSNQPFVHLNPPLRRVRVALQVVKRFKNGVPVPHLNEGLIYAGFKKNISLLVVPDCRMGR